MSDLELLRRLSAADHGLAVVATTRADRSVQASVVNAGLLEDPLTGALSVAFVSRGGARRLVNLRRHPLMTVVFRSGWQWVSVEGPTRIIGPDDPAEGFSEPRLAQLLRQVFTAAGGTHDNWEEYDAVMAADRRAAVFVAPERIAGNG